MIDEHQEIPDALDIGKRERIVQAMQSGPGRCEQVVQQMVEEMRQQSSWVGREGDEALNQLHVLEALLTSR